MNAESLKRGNAIRSELENLNNQMVNITKEKPTYAPRIIFNGGEVDVHPDDVRLIKVVVTQRRGDKIKGLEAEFAAL